ncbi:hypothetical protein GCM10009799_42710 [Nocardiopsis rhodophaea]|uniref:Barstar (barnase inhibitor) domain-containing protein n=1 Tax=Nocardiopsis rhodophaea TaxID=280238 RepID=A0ABN2THT9_9ACTN
MILDLSDESTPHELLHALTRGFQTRSIRPRSLAEFRALLAKAAAPPQEIHFTGWGEFRAQCPVGARELRALIDEHRERHPEAIVTYTDSPTEIRTTIDLSGVTSGRDLHRLLKRELDFPDMYGMNWDAFWDAITGLVQLPAAIRFVGWRHLETTVPRDARMLRRILDEYLARTAGDPEQPTVSYEE